MNERQFATKDTRWRIYNEEISSRTIWSPRRTVALEVILVEAFFCFFFSSKNISIFRSQCHESNSRNKINFSFIVSLFASTKQHCSDVILFMLAVKLLSLQKLPPPSLSLSLPPKGWPGKHCQTNSFERHQWRWPLNSRAHAAVAMLQTLFNWKSDDPALFSSSSPVKESFWRYSCG